MNGATRYDETQGVPPRIDEGRRTPFFPIPFILICVAGVCALMLYFFNPAQFRFYPTCALYKITGLLCPGCGGLRAAHELMHGHFAEAFRLNAILVLSIPAAALIGGRFLIRKLRREPFRFTVRPLWFWVGLIALALFGIFRNLPFAQAHGLVP